VTYAEFKRDPDKAGCRFGTQRGSHWKVSLGDRHTVLPWHPKKEISTGLMNAIGKQLGLKKK